MTQAPQRSFRNRARLMAGRLGFTLIELMVIVSITALLLAVATPSFMGMAKRNRIITYTNEFITSLNHARSEAIRRGMPVSLCPSSDAATCTAATTWSDGWIIFANANGDAVVDVGDTVMATHESLSTNYTIDSTGLATVMTFQRNGSAASTGVFAVCHDNNTEDARAIIVTLLRPRVGRDTDNNRIPNDDANADIADCAP